MIKTALYHLFVPMGRTSRRTFWITLAAFAALVTVFKWGLFQHDTTGAVYFWGFLIWMTMLFCGLFAIYGKRLKDFGRSVWAIVLLLTALIVVMMVLMLAFGGAEYFEAYSHYERKAEIDEAVKARINARYEERLASATPWVSTIMSAMIVGFTLWVGLARGDAGTNRYGPPPIG
ncbi:MAG: DUF805 domain-containing protein [Litorimonas sp.]